MKCQVRDPYTGKCPARAEITLPNGTKLCKPHALEWSNTRIERHSKELAAAWRVWGEAS